MRFHANQNVPRLVSMTKGEKRVVDVNFLTVAEGLDTTVSSAAWSRRSDLVSISGESLASGVASAYIDATESGQTSVKVVATLADGSTLVVMLNLKINQSFEGV
jgi:hypothetical protein